MSPDTTETYRIEYTMPWILRCEDHQFALQYRDVQGTVTLYGFEKPHASGRLVWFPDAMEWDRCFPDRKGQRGLIQSRLREWVSKYQSFRYLEPSLMDGYVYRGTDPDVLRLKPSPPKDVSWASSPQFEEGMGLARKGFEILKQKNLTPEELQRAVELMQAGARLIEKSDDKPK